MKRHLGEIEGPGILLPGYDGLSSITQLGSELILDGGSEIHKSRRSVLDFRPDSIDPSTEESDPLPEPFLMHNALPH